MQVAYLLLFSVFLQDVCGEIFVDLVSRPLIQEWQGLKPGIQGCRSSEVTQNEWVCVPFHQVLCGC